MVGATLVAKKQAPKKKTGPKPKDDKRDALVTFKCRKEYKDWLQEIARIQRDIPSRLIDLALIDYAAKHSLPAPPER